ncbi:MAG: hypothetical protein IJ424_06660 [Oscillospiraceae bacterium]|nr:hypothetical protein [Oscillospiraceae bacterium]
MDKNEILEKAQNTKGDDEREQLLYKTASDYAMAIGVMVCGIIVILKSLADLPAWDVMAVYDIMLGVRGLYYSIKLRKIARAVIYGILLAAGVALLISYALTIL